MIQQTLWTDDEALLALRLYKEIRPVVLQKIREGGLLSLAMYLDITLGRGNMENPQLKAIIQQINRPCTDIVSAVMEFVYLDPDTESKGTGNVSPAMLNAWNSDTGNSHDSYSHAEDSDKAGDDGSTPQTPAAELEIIKGIEEKLNIITSEIEGIIRIEVEMEGLSWHGHKGAELIKDALGLQKQLNKLLEDVTELKESESLKALQDNITRIRSIMDKFLNEQNLITEERGETKAAQQNEGQHDEPTDRAGTLYLDIWSRQNHKKNLTKNLIESVAQDKDLITLEKADSMQILNPNGIPMFIRPGGLSWGDFRIVKNKKEYDGWIDCLAANNRKISVKGIIIGTFEDFREHGFILKRKDKNRQHRQIYGGSHKVGKFWKSNAHYYLNYEDFHRA